MLMKRLIFVILAVTAISTSVQAKYSGGSGTSGSPYQIANVTDLLTLAENTGDYGKYFILTADINLASCGTFKTAVIAPSSAESDFSGVAFTGLFDGNWHKISNLTIDTNDIGASNLGLFGSIDDGGEVINLGVENVSVTGNDSYLHWTNDAGGLAAYNNGTIDNCYSTGVVNCSYYGNQIGGLVGSNDGAVTNSHSSATVSGTDEAGGLTGSNDGNIINCFSSGNVSSIYSVMDIGGLVGGNSANIKKCYSTSNVTGGEQTIYIGGLAGENFGGFIENCYATGSITAGATSEGVGGLIGRTTTNVRFCYSTGTVTAGTGSTYVAGLVGDHESGAVDYCYFINRGLTSNSTGTAVTDTQMKEQDTFTLWDFTNVWTITEGVSYPKLAWQSDTDDSNTVTITKCTVTAGSKPNTDKISFSGTMNATADDFNDAYNSVDVNFVAVSVSAEDMDPCLFYLPVNNKTWKKGKFSSTVTSKPLKISFTFDSKKKTFSFSASDVNLKGLSCPVDVEVQVGNWYASTEVDETIVNGKNPIPVVLLMGVKNSLSTNKFKVKKSSKTDSDQLTISGSFSAQDSSIAMSDSNFIVSFNGQSFTLAANSFKKSKSAYKCSKILSDNGLAEITASFDFGSATFALSLTKANLTYTQGVSTPVEFDFSSYWGKVYIIPQ